MTRTALPFATKDVSALARSLQRELAAHDGAPGHVQLLNMLARAGGYRNFQHFRAQQSAADRLEAPPVAAEPVDHRRVERVARYFDGEGRLTAWPAKTVDQRLAAGPPPLRRPGATAARAGPDRPDDPHAGLPRVPTGGAEAADRGPGADQGRGALAVFAALRNSAPALIQMPAKTTVIGQMKWP